MSAREEPPQPRETQVEMNRLGNQFAHLVANVQDYAIFLLDPQGNVRSWNAGAERIKGYTASEILRKHFSIFYSPEDVARRWPQQELEIATREGRFETEGWRYRKDGSRFWASVTITAERADDGSLEGFLKITRDLTDRRRAEESLRESEERFRLLIEGVREYAIFALTPEGRIATWNTGAQRIKGYSADEVIGKSFSMFYTPEAAARGKPEWLLRAAVEHGSVEDEDWRVRKDGQRFWANVVITALRDEQGQLRGFAKVTRDLTERRQIDQLQQADRFKNEFLALLAHELRNPLAPIRSALQVLVRRSPENPEIAQAKEIADRQIRHMTRLLDDLLDVARISEGKLEIRREAIDAAEIVRRAVDAELPFVQERGLELSVDLPQEAAGVDADPVRLQQIFVNLLNNAAKYTDPGGKITVSARAEGGQVVVRVRDTGIGIEPFMVPRLFEPFVQVERREKRSVGGVGLGLAVVRKLVEMHEGSVHVFSAGLGRGSEFVVRLPQVRIGRSARESRAPGAGVAPAANPQRILVADDNVDAADGLKLLLELGGDQVRVAYDGVSALAVAREFRPQVALLDVGMPRLDGYEIARRMRAAEETRGTVLIAVTGWGQPEDRRRSQAAGFDYHLVKPVDPSTLERLLETIRANRAG
ncbi:MAG TPA: PAS domain S-box protein [Thermoanaerobaculia bacterium]